MRRFVKSGLGLVAAAAAFAALSATPAEATTVVYSTLGCFDLGLGCTLGPTAVAADSSGSAVVAFVGESLAVADASPVTFSSLGHFDSTFTTAPATLPSIPFTLEIAQFLPGSPNTGTLVASIAGFLSPTSSGAKVTFSTSTTTINGIQYDLFPSNIVPINPKSSPSGGVTSLTAQITAVPEPASALMLMFGAAGLIARRRRA